MFGWDRTLLEGDNKISRYWREQPDEYWSERFNRLFTPRDALQLIGTEVGREIFHNDFWLFKLEQKLKMDINYVITDVRFPNEIEFTPAMDEAA